MSVTQRTHSPEVPIGILATFALIGLYDGMELGDPGVTVTWFWIGLGLVVMNYLYRLVVTMEAILETITS